MLLLKVKIQSVLYNQHPIGIMCGREMMEQHFSLGEEERGGDHHAISNLASWSQIRG